jgi:2-polyprenyl-6-methoxyphenol hydroxylase-like FAD-dependent oxidoreductase
MSRIVVLGGGVVGLSMALMLTRYGHQVTVLERDGAPVPDSPDQAWQAWDRRGVAQFRQPHYLHPGGRQVLDALLPDVRDAVLAARGSRFDVLTLMPPGITDRAPRYGDERFVTVTGRRPVLEYAVAATAGQCLDVRRGTQVTGLLAGAATATGVPNVTGVRLADGQELAADLVIDAMGRRSGLPGWLAAVGARPPAEEAGDSGFIYYTRYFRATEAAVPPFRAGLMTPFDCFSLVTLPGDAQTWSVTIYISAHDRALKKLRDPSHWTALVAACPMHAHLLDGKPVSDVVAMSGLVNRYRRLVADGIPVATGIVSVGDSQACTNPSLGRGITTGLLHAAGTLGVVLQHLGDPLALACAHDQMSQARVRPWYEDTIEFDRQRKEQIDASIDGRPARAPAGPAALARSALPVAMQADADLFRAFAEINAMITPPRQVMARPGLIDRILDIARGRPPEPPPGPSRDQVLRLLA